ARETGPSVPGGGPVADASPGDGPVADAVPGGGPDLPYAPGARAAGPERTDGPPSPEDVDTLVVGRPVDTSARDRRDGSPADERPAAGSRRAADPRVPGAAGSVPRAAAGTGLPEAAA
ncbi:hypothetical protein RKE29_30605, partial [Streptomyces sp. B1866]|nr:hypothetical protein [Streptomyces sp. B1866]